MIIMINNVFIFCEETVDDFIEVKKNFDTCLSTIFRIFLTNLLNLRKNGSVVE